MVIGNAGNDPVMRYTVKGDPITTFRIATNRSYTGANGEKKDETEWFSVVAFRQLAEQVNEYMRKGRRAYVEGRLQSRTWQAQDGTSRFSNEIVAEKVMFLDRQQADGPAEESAVAESGSVEPEDLPF